MAMYIKDGKNLFNVDAITGVENNAARIIRKGKGIGISRGAYSSGLVFKGNEVYLPVGEYTFSAIVENDMDELEYDYAYVALWGLTSKATLIKMTKVFAKSKEKLVYNFSITTADTYGFRLQGRGDAATASDMKFYYYDIQLEKGTEATSYLPFNGTQRVKVLDKYGIRNEFDISKLVNVNGISHTGRDFSKTNSYASGSSTKTVQQVFPFIVAGETYTFACTVESSAGSEDASGMITCLQTNKQLIPPKLGYVKRVVTINADDLQCLFYPYGLSNGTITWKDFMCVKGDYSNKEMPEYRPFTKILNPRIFAKS